MRICPNCRAEIMELILPTNPPKRQNQCFKCGWRGEIKGGEISKEKTIAD